MKIMYVELRIRNHNERLAFKYKKSYWKTCLSYHRQFLFLLLILLTYSPENKSVVKTSLSSWDFMQMLKFFKLNWQTNVFMNVVLKVWLNNKQLLWRFILLKSVINIMLELMTSASFAVSVHNTASAVHCAMPSLHTTPLAKQSAMLLMLTANVL